VVPCRIWMVQGTTIRAVSRGSRGGRGFMVIRDYVRSVPILLLAGGLALLALVDWRATAGVGLVCIARDVQLRDTLRSVLRAPPSRGHTRSRGHHAVGGGRRSKGVARAAK
jgi:hypothetical protein